LHRWADASGCGVLVPAAKQNRRISRLRWIRDAVLERAAGAMLIVLEGAPEIPDALCS
jgi:hypothetical protein